MTLMWKTAPAPALPALPSLWAAVQTPALLFASSGTLGLSLYLAASLLGNVAFWDSAPLVLLPMLLLSVLSLVGAVMMTVMVAAAVTAPQQWKESRVQHAFVWTGLTLFALLTQFVWANMAVSLICTA